MNTTLFGTTCVGIARVSTYIQDTTAQAETLQNKAQELGLTMEKTFETKDPDEAIKWINEMEKLGYTTDITFDETTGLYILIATK